MWYAFLIVSADEFICRLEQPPKWIPFEHAKMKTAEQWLEENNFSSAVADDAIVEWMAK